MGGIWSLCGGVRAWEGPYNFRSSPKSRDTLLHFILLFLFYRIYPFFGFSDVFCHRFCVRENFMCLNVNIYVKLGGLWVEKKISPISICDNIETVHTLNSTIHKSLAYTYILLRKGYTTIKHLKCMKIFETNPKDIYLKIQKNIAN